MDPEVLIVGAGPTGLALALWLAHFDIRVRIIDRAEASASTSRAVVVHARTLEQYRQLGLADDVVRAGHEFSTLNVWARGTQRASIEFGRMGEGRSPFPFVLTYPQDAHERLLEARLRQQGVDVERGVELTRFEEIDGRLRATLNGPGGASSCDAIFLAGCDGARSTVREAMGIGFPGGTYEHTFYVADVEAEGPAIDGQLHIALDDDDFAGIFPLDHSHVRLIGIVRPDATGGHALGWEDVSTRVLERMHLTVRELRWFSTYKVHHRVAAHFRSGNSFLLGDAAHIHSPVGGQGMNTGLGDAANLAWKLAAVLRGRAPTTLLDSFEAERIGFARRLTETTDRIFQLATRPSQVAGLVRTNLYPRVASVLFRWPPVRRYAFRTVSQTAITYRNSALSEGRAGRVHGGDRLPWVPLEEGDNFEPLRSLEWQVHVYGTASRPLIELCAARGLALNEFPCSAMAQHAGLQRDACYLVRPDGYVGFADPAQDPSRLERYLDRLGIRLVPRAAEEAAHV